MNNNDFKQKITKKKILASTIQFSNNTNTHNKPMKHSSAHHKHPQKRNNRLSQTPNSHDKPNNNFANPTPKTVPTPTHNTLTISPTPTRRGAHLLPSSTQQPPQKMIEPATYSPRNKTKNIKLLRKEVIQPHLPVRLPCYDFVPIANPTFDSSLTSLGHWLRVLPTFMT